MTAKKKNKKEELVNILNEFPRLIDTSVMFVAAVDDESDEYVFLAVKHGNPLSVVEKLITVNHKDAKEIVKRYRR